MTTTETTDDLAVLARETGFSTAAVDAMRRAIARGGGRMAQFDHPEFGGPGQWMRGGMLMLGVPDDRRLHQRVDALCEALAATADGVRDRHVDRWPASRPWPSQSSGPDRPAPDTGGAWWPASLGDPDASGGQDGSGYAWFAASRRLAVQAGGRVTVHDTGEHRLVGVSQTQGGAEAMVFTGDRGPIDVARLPIVPVDADLGAGRAAERTPSPATGRVAPEPATGPAIDPFAALEKLAALHARGIVDDGEYAAKKAELLRRI